MFCCIQYTRAAFPHFSCIILKMKIKLTRSAFGKRLVDFGYTRHVKNDLMHRAFMNKRRTGETWPAVSIVDDNRIHKRSEPLLFISVPICDAFTTKWRLPFISIGIDVWHCRRQLLLIIPKSKMEKPITNQRQKVKGKLYRHTTTNAFNECFLTAGRSRKLKRQGNGSGKNYIKKKNTESKEILPSFNRKYQRKWWEQIAIEKGIHHRSAFKTKIQHEKSTISIVQNNNTPKNVFPLPLKGMSCRDEGQQEMVYNNVCVGLYSDISYTQSR